jgi:two-component system, chemotaxis family, sensor kinase CheA
MEEIQVDRQALLQTFVDEAGEILGRIERDVIALEARPDDGELLHGLFRAAHTLKGSAGLVGFDAVTDLAHQLEELLDRLRSRSLAVDGGLVSLLLQSADALREAVAAGGTALSPSARTLCERIAGMAASAAHVVGAPGAALDPLPARPSPSSARTLRVDVRKLDRMLDLTGEIGIARGRLTDMLERRASLAAEDVLAAHRDADRLYLDLQELVMKARMVPVGPVFHQHLRLVRDLASSQGKRISLCVEGGEAEVDTAVVEAIRDPLTHMVRNAVDHGIERPEVRIGRGKDPCGRLVLRAFHEAGTIVLQVADDGSGLPRERIAVRAQALGLVLDAAKVTDEEIGRLVFEPGLSTSETVTEVSGRGVGMDVVRRNVEALRGTASVESREGAGTCVTIRLPLTLAIIQGFKVGVAGETYILPLETVLECVELPLAGRDDTSATGVVDLRGRPLPYVRLREIFGVRGPRPRRENVVVVRHGSATAGIAVDVLLGESQTVIKPLGRMFQGLPGISGSSILGDGRVALILDVARLLRLTSTRRETEASMAAGRTTETEPRLRTGEGTDSKEERTCSDP